MNFLKYNERTMNILFYTSWEVSPEQGGTERITYTLAAELQKTYNFKCFSIYNKPIRNPRKDTPFIESKQIISDSFFEENLYQFIKKNKINIIINQGNFESAEAICNAIQKYGSTKLLTVHHYSPGAEEKFLNCHNLIYNIQNKKNITRNILLLILYPIAKLKKHYQIRTLYQKAYKYSDAVILLSEKFRDEFMRYAHISSSEKFHYIHNALSFNYFFNMKDYNMKQKEVLIVSRLDEIYKRISIALNIWKEVEQLEDLKEWKLTIVGHGDEYKEKYQKQISRLKLKRVSMQGLQDPTNYYKRASIFMMTSRSEGWGLTLTEAQQYGVVPLAFNSYSSLSDIITNNVNGIIIPNNDTKEYINKLIILMRNDELRKTLAQKAISTSHRFETKKICEQWKDLLLKVSSQE